MKIKNLKEIISFETASIKDVMRIIDHSGLRVAYIVDEKGKLSGVVSDSEIRKSIIEGKDVKSPVRGIINSDPVILEEKYLANKYVVRTVMKKLLSRMPDSQYMLVVKDGRIPKKIVPLAQLLEQNSNFRKKIYGNGKKVLVVGGAGYLGSVLIRKLIASGFRVRVLDILMYGVEPVRELFKDKRFELVKGDMRNISTMVRVLDGIDAVINLSAIVGDPACKNRPQVTIETNFLANKTLAEACKYHQVNKFIYASTCSVYGAVDGNKEVTEESALNPVSLYARSKIESEEGILALEDENFAPVILRMGTLYGYSYRMRFDLVVNAMTKTALLDKKIKVNSGGLQWRPLLHVHDAAEAYVKCLQAPLSKIKGQIFNVGSSRQNYRIIDIARIVNKHIPKAALVFEGEKSDNRNYCVSFVKIEKSLKFKCVHNLEDSIKRIRKAIQKKEIRDVNNPKYYNEKYIL